MHHLCCGLPESQPIEFLSNFNGCHCVPLNVGTMHYAKINNEQNLVSRSGAVEWREVNKICDVSFHTRQWAEVEGQWRNSYNKQNGTHGDCWWGLEEQWRKGTNYMLIEELQNLLSVVMWKTEKEYNDPVANWGNFNTEFWKFYFASSRYFVT